MGSAITLDRIRNHLAARSMDDHSMKLLVHVPITVFVRLDEVALGKNFVALAEALVKRLDQPPRRSLLGQRARGKPFEHTADINRVHDLLGREFAHHEPARIQLHQDSFLRQDRESLANRSAGNSEAACQLHLSHPLAGLEIAVQNHLANSYDHS